MTAPRFIAQRSPIGLRVPRPGRFVPGTRSRRETDGSVSPRELRTTEGGVRDYATPGSRVARPEERARCQGTIRVVQLDESRSVRGAVDCVQTGLLVAQQAARPGAREVPVTPIVALEPLELLTQPSGDAALRPSVESRKSFEQTRHHIRAERCGIPTVERTLGGRAREVGPDDEDIGIHEMEDAQHGETLHEPAEREPAARPSQGGPGEPPEQTGEVQHEGRGVEAVLRQT